MSFKGFSIFSSGSYLVHRSRIILAISVGSQLGIIPVKSESKWLKGLGRVAFTANFYVFFFSTEGHFVHQTSVAPTPMGP